MIPEITARHEAAHAVIARLNGAHVVSCEVVDHFLLNRNSGGSCRWIPLASENAQMQRVHSFTDMSIVIAGSLAVRIYCPAAAIMCQNREINDFDLREFHRLAVLYTFGDNNGQIDPDRTRNQEGWELPIMGEVWGATELDLRANWDAVEAVAKWLIRFGNINEAQIDRAITKAGGRRSVVSYLLEHGDEAEKAAAKKVRMMAAARPN
jgi:hypothetical protein